MFETGIMSLRILRDPETSPTEHSALEDVYAMLTGTTLLAIGLVLMKAAGIVTAGVAGLALLASYVTGMGVGTLFGLLNLPFLLLALKVLGRRLALRTAATILLVLVQVRLLQTAADIRWIHPAYAAVAGGTVVGAGILVLVRHNCSVGGANLVALWAKQRRGWNVGRLTLVLDMLVLSLATAEIPLARLGWSLLSIVATNAVLIAFHRPGRYLGR